MKYTDILFDLDGTLTDPMMGITNAVMYALRHFGIEVADRRELYPFIGPPLTDSFEKFYGFSHEQALEAVKEYRVYFSDIGLFENEVYDGIPQLLQALTAAGAHLSVASSKPTVFVERILEHFDLRRYFDTVVGSELGGERVEKEDVIAFVMQKRHLNSNDAVLMVGDRSFDVQGATINGIPAVGVAYGYGERDEFQGAVYVADTVADLQTFLLL